MSVVEVARDGHVATVVLNRPEARNAMNPEMIVTLVRTWEELRADDDVRAIVVTGASGSTFCAGFDLASYIPLMTGTRQPEDEWDRAVTDDPGLPAKATLRDLVVGKPVVAAANGHAIAGGMELLLAADLRVVAEGARLGLSEVALGLIPAMGGTARLGTHLPSALAAELLLTARPISAERAAEAGMVNRLVPADEVLATARELAELIASNAPLAARAALEVMRASRDLSEQEALDLEAQRAAELATTEDAREGPSAFMEKRDPVFRGR